MSKKPKLTLDEALALRFNSDAGKGLTIRGYLQKLLLTLWDEGEGFSGKRPFGNSCWEYDLYIPLIKAGVIPGSLDSDGYVANYDRTAAYQYVVRLIKHALKDPA